ncbi:MAG: YdeI/OmpD-associated family protein [Limnobacter sp.]|uniref:YdeI/OmpD-associated family protein n=1 Tax=Limnobacter sp. TaxID=2003368 RepID=UPI0022BEF22D|nr:YdeI/OmpD-associated family protein [Limnobacter sp.]MCZ8014475.1 YdeI/OmpD-associated family protein [Limnobacter sp.]
MAYFTHRFEASVSLHPVGTYNYTVVYLDPELHASLPLKEIPRLRIEADISGVPVKGAWQPSGGRWYLMLPKIPLRNAGISIGSVVEVAFKVLPQDQVDVPPELSAALQAQPNARNAWSALSAGKQRSLAHMIASAKRSETKQARLEQVIAILLGEAPLPWARK